MGTKTFFVDDEAYLMLARAKRHARESFSKVIKRAKWDEGRPRCGDLLARAAGRMPGEALDALDAAQESDPPSRWRNPRRWSRETWIISPG